MSLDASVSRLPLPVCRTEGFDLLQRPVWVLDTDTMRKCYANAAARALWQVAPGDEAEFYARDFAPHSPAIRSRLARTFERLRVGEIFIERWTFYPGGRPFTADCLMSGVRLDNGHVGMLVEAMVAEVEVAERRGVEALRHTQAMVTLYNGEGEVLFRNPAAARCFPGEAHTFVSGFADRAEGQALWRAAVSHDPAQTDAFMGLTVSGDFHVTTSEGARWHGIDIRTTTDPVDGGVAIVVNERDITDRVQAQARSEFLATHDAMTGLVNRSRFTELLERSMAEETRGGLITIDLDSFKEINDTHGHAAGDVVLREIGQRLLACARPDDICARIGGDEFALILPGFHDPADLRRRAAELDVRLGQIISAPENGGMFTIAASFGIARWPRDGTRPDVLQRNADLALYAAKGENGQRISQFDMLMRLDADERHQVVEDLAASVERDEFSVYFQPIVDLAAGAPSGFEALLRWRHPMRGLVMPDRFIPAAESVGLMAPIGRLMFEQTCQQIRAWLDAGLEPGCVAVNLSANQFRYRELAQQIIDIVARNGLTPSRIEFEVPETVTLGRSGETVLDTLSHLRQVGFSIALDDFGTGHASLTHLRRLPVGTIKIDRSFIADMERSGVDRAIVHAVIALGRELGMRVLAEGIENEAQRSTLVGLGCDLGQGYLFGRPMAPAEATRWLRGQTRPGSSRRGGSQ